jgi:glycosyltransferase involved in cell wall biosynthesis
MAEADVLVLPSLIECGGAVVLEAMAVGLPVIATAWGGPADYLDATCGVLIPPASHGAYVTGLIQAMRRLAHGRDLRRAMGAAGRRKVMDLYSWESKVDRMIAIYERAAAAQGEPAVGDPARRA